MLYDRGGFFRRFLDQLHDRLRKTRGAADMAMERLVLGPKARFQIRRRLRDMTNADLAKSYIWKAETRIDALEALNDSEVVREAQETVKLALKGMLRAVGVKPPKHHDVGRLLLEHRERFGKDVADIWRAPQKFQSACARNVSWLFMETWILFPRRSIQLMTLAVRWTTRTGSWS